MLDAVKKFLKEEDGLTSVEYAACGALILGGIVLAFDTLEGSVSGVLGRISAALELIV